MNPVYKLIGEWNKFMKEDFILFHRTSATYKDYYMLVSRSRDRSKIIVGEKELTAVGYHITVYDELRKEVQDSTFHITISLIDANKNSYVARIFYGEDGEYLFNVIKDKKGNIITFDDTKHLLEFAADNITPFVEKIQCLRKTYVEKYQSLNFDLAQRSSELIDVDITSSRAALLEYQRELQDMIRHIHSNTLFNRPYLNALKFYEHSLSDTEEKLSLMDMEVTPVVGEEQKESDSKESVQPASAKSGAKKVAATGKATRKKAVVEATGTGTIAELKKKIDIILESKQITPIDKVLQEYELEKQIFALFNNSKGRISNKIERSKRDDELLDATIRCNQLSEEINKIITNDFNNNKTSKTINPETMLALLQHCTLATDVLVDLAVRNNRVSELAMLMQIRRDVNLEVKPKGCKQFLLEIAYHHHALDMFQFLLDNKVSPNIICENKQPILFHACMKDRSKEMEALLEAGANPLAVDLTGFTPLGALLMRSDRSKANIPQAEVFLTYAPQTIEQLQGRKGGENIPLAYACQENRREVVELLLQFGANPNRTRFDGLSSFAVCVYKDNFELFKFIVEHSMMPIREGLSNALDIAVISKKEQFIKYILNYSDEHQLNLSRPDMDEAKNNCKKLKKVSAEIYSSRNNANLFYSNIFAHDDSDDEPNICIMYL